MLALTTVDLFRATWPRHTAKQAARAAGSPVSTAKAWVQRRFTPSADTFLRMITENQELRAELMRALQGDAYADVASAADREVRATTGAVVAPAGGSDQPAAGVGRRK